MSIQCCYEVARENINAVKGQYVHEEYREEGKEYPDNAYILILREKRLELQRLLNAMYKYSPEKIKDMMHEYGTLYKQNKKMIVNIYCEKRC